MARSRVLRQIDGVEARTGGVVDVNGAWTTLQKRSKKGALSRKAKTHIDVTADPLIVMPDAKQAAGLYAAAVADEARRQLAAITMAVSPATLERRRRYQRDRSSASYARRYANTTKRGPSGFTASGTGYDTARGGAGGRGVGHLPPTVSPRWGTDSGRLSHLSVRIRQRSTGEAVATINVPANRLDPLLWGEVGEGLSWEQFRAELQRLAPVFAGDLSSDSRTRARIKAVLEDVAKDAIATSEAQYRRLIAKRRQLIAGILADVTGLSGLRAVGQLLGK